MTTPDSHPTERFSSRAEAYARARPGYPAGAMEWLSADLAPNGIAVDVGAGTGLSSVALSAVLGPSWRVLAIEPNRAMRESAPHDPSIDWRDGTAETTGLDDSSCDLIVCAQAFHWFDGPRSLAEFRRILRDDRGRVALVWNTHDTTRDEMAEYRDLMMEHAKEPPSSPSCSGWKRADVSALEASGEFGTIETRSFTNLQSLSLQGLIDRALSSSYMPSEGDEGGRVREDLSSYFDRHANNGAVRLTYDCVVYRAEAIPR